MWRKISALTEARYLLLSAPEVVRDEPSPARLGELLRLGQASPAYRAIVVIRTVSCDLDHTVPGTQPIHFSLTFIGTQGCTRNSDAYLAV